MSAKIESLLKSSEGLEELTHQMKTKLRHERAIEASDIQELRDNLWSAAERFQDIADLMEKDPNYRDTAFLRASARRYHRASGLARPLSGPSHDR